MKPNDLIEQFINDSNYKIYKTGRILTKLDRAGRQTNPVKWRKCTSRKSRGETVWYQYQPLQVNRIIYRKFNGKLNENLIITFKDGNKFNNHYKNLKQVAFKNVVKPPIPNHPNHKKYFNSKRNEKILSIENALSNFNFTWLNKEEYKDIKSFCNLKCVNRHVFTVHSRTILKSLSCPACCKNLFLGETISKVILEILLGFKLEKTRRIEGLIDPKTGGQLEIDGFNYDQGIGFEYQGQQHYKFIEFIHKNLDNFKDLQTKDGLKKDFFKSKNWTLLEISQFEYIEIENAIGQIKQILKEQAPNFLVKEVPNEIIINSIKLVLFGEKYLTSNLTELLSNFDYYNKGMKYLNENGAELISGSFRNKDSVIVIKTKQGKIWKTKVDCFLRAIDKGSVNQVNKINLKEEELKRVLLIAQNFKTLTDFKKAHKNLAEWVRRHRYTNELRAVFGLDKSSCSGTRKYTDEYLINEAKKFVTRGQMYKKGRNAYELILLRKLQSLAFAHMIKPSRKKTN